MPTPPSCFCHQQLWFDNLMPTPTWEDKVKSKPTYLANFEWLRSCWNLLNGSKTMNILAITSIGEIKNIAQMWVIGKLEYITLVFNQYPTFIIKFCLANDNCNTL